MGSRWEVTKKPFGTRVFRSTDDAFKSELVLKLGHVRVSQALLGGSVGWAEGRKNRLNPESVSLLTATSGVAFDKHFISFDEDYRMILSSVCLDHYSSKSTRECFISLEGGALRRAIK